MTVKDYWYISDTYDVYEVCVDRDSGEIIYAEYPFDGWKDQFIVALLDYVDTLKDTYATRMQK